LDRLDGRIFLNLTPRDKERLRQAAVAEGRPLANEARRLILRGLDGEADLVRGLARLMMLPHRGGGPPRNLVSKDRRRPKAGFALPVSLLNQVPRAHAIRMYARGASRSNS
jgi:hypothetical protein